jgi:hypothetical protein
MEAQQRAMLVADMFFRDVRQKLAMIVKTDSIVATAVRGGGMLHTVVIDPSINPQQLYCESFTVTAELMGLAIGARGANITLARQIPGVHQIHTAPVDKMAGRQSPVLIRIYAEVGFMA